MSKDNKGMNILKIGAGLVAGLLVAGVPLAIELDQSTKTISDLTSQVSTLNTNLAAEKLNVKEITVSVPVDNEKLSVVEQFIYDNDGNVSMLEVSDLDDDEVSLIADRIVFVNEAKDLAVSAIKSDLFDELDNEKFVINSTTVEFDDKELGSLRVNDDYEDLVVDVTDFDDKEAKVTVTGTFKQEGVKYAFKALVTIEDNEVDKVDVKNVTLA